MYWLFYSHIDRAWRDCVRALSLFAIRSSLFLCQLFRGGRMCIQLVSYEEEEVVLVGPTPSQCGHQPTGRYGILSKLGGWNSV